MVGLDNAGKTTILYQYLMNEVVQTSPTIGSNVEEVVFRNIHFLVWDLGGQQSLRSAWSTYYTNTEVGDCRVVVGRDSWGRLSVQIRNCQHVTDRFCRALAVYHHGH